MLKKETGTSRICKNIDTPLLNYANTASTDIKSKLARTDCWVAKSGKGRTPLWNNKYWGIYKSQQSR